MYENRQPPEMPPCENCFVELLEENQDAAMIYTITRNQLIMGFNGPISISHSAIHAAMELYDIGNRKECFTKVLYLAQWWIDKMNSKKV